MNIFFMSKNKFKHEEARHILAPLGINVEGDHTAIHELQTTDVEVLVRDKAVRAFRKLGRPLFAEPIVAATPNPSESLSIFLKNLRQRANVYAAIQTSPTDKKSKK